MREGGLPAQSLHDLVAVLPQTDYCKTAAAQQNNHHNRNDDCIVAFLGFDGHLVIHDFYSSGEIRLKMGRLYQVVARWARLYSQ